MASMSEMPSNQPQASADLVSSDATSPTSHHATHAVLNTKELLCGIIIRLPFEDIVVATGVCKTWREVLKDNVAIQQALFLTPTEITDIVSETECLSMSLEDIPRDQYCIIAKFNSRFVDLWMRTKSADGTGSGVTRFIPQPQRTLLSHPSGLWRDMFVTQPPIKAFFLRTGNTEFKCFRCETGIKMGELYDAYESLFPPGRIGTLVDAERFISVDEPYFFHNGRWEVRDGKVSRQTRPRLIDLEYDDSVDERDPHFYWDSREEFRSDHDDSDDDS
jgi:hypothetical protein